MLSGSPRVAAVVERMSDVEVTMSNRTTALLACGLLVLVVACTASEPTAPSEGTTASDAALFAKPAPPPHSYAIVKGGTWTWSEAKSAARRLPATSDRARPHLATFATEAEQSEALANATGDGWCWFGLYQGRKATNPADGWKWITREDVTWTDWNTGEPNDGNGYESGGEDVAYLRFGGAAPVWSYWIDIPETSTLDCMIVEWE